MRWKRAVRGDPTPVCNWCATYLEHFDACIQHGDGRLSCIPCEADRQSGYRPRDAVAQSPTDIEVERAIVSIKKAGRGEVR